MDFFSEHLLTIILFFPVIAALVIWVIPSDQVRAIRWTALLASLVPLGVAIYLWQVFDPNQAGFQFVRTLSSGTTPLIHPSRLAWMDFH